MGSFQTKNTRKKDVDGLREKVKNLQEEINEITCTRETESQSYEQEIMIFSLKESEWKREKKKLKDEVKRLRKLLEEREERVRGMEEEMAEGKGEKELQFLGSRYFLEQMRGERERRDEAVEKWKRLYLAIKMELDDLILMTHQGRRLSWRAEEEDLTEELQRELKAKGETIELLQARLAAMEQEESNREREVDILRQSLKIMSHNKNLPTKISKGLSRSLHL